MNFSKRESRVPRLQNLKCYVQPCLKPSIGTKSLAPVKNALIPVDLPLSKNVQKLQCRIYQHLQQSMRKMTKPMRIGKESLRMMAKKKLKLRSFKFCKTGKTPLSFVECGVKTNAECYQNQILRDVLPWSRQHYENFFLGYFRGK